MRLLMLVGGPRGQGCGVPGAPAPWRRQTWCLRWDAGQVFRKGREGHVTSAALVPSPQTSDHAATWQTNLAADTRAGRTCAPPQGAKSGVVRFSEPAQAQQVVAGADAEGGMMVAGYRAAVKVLEGEEEKEYMIKVATARAEHKQDDRRPGGRGFSGRGRGRGRGGRGGRRGGRR